MTVISPVAADSKSLGSLVKKVSLVQVAAVLVAAILIIFGVITNNFFTLSTFQGILNTSGIIAIVSIGVTFMTLSGNLFTLSASVTVLVLGQAFLELVHLGPFPAILIILVMGAIIFGLQGWLVGRLGANVIIITVAAGFLQQGVAEYLSGSNPSILAPAGITSYLWMRNTYGGILFSVWAMFGIVILGELFLRRTVAGRQIYLVGENRAAARTAGINVKRVTIIAFIAAGICIAFAATLQAAYTQNVYSQGPYTFDAIVAVLIGGTSVLGGKGSLIRTVFGALVVSYLSQMMIMRGYNPPTQIFVQGLLLFGVVVVMQLSERGRN